MKFNLFSLILFFSLNLKVFSQAVPGIDVSQWQGTIDWVQVKASDNVFAYVRATDGLATTDPTFQTNITDGLAAGMIMGAYCFGRPSVSAIASAQHFVSVAGAYIGQGYLPPVLDIEVLDGMTYAAVSIWIQDWITEVELLTGVSSMIYTGGYFGNQLFESLNNYPLWIAHWGVSYPTILGIWNDWLFWQHTGTGSVAGISGNVNLNIFNGDSIALDSLVGLNTTSIEGEMSSADDFVLYPNPANGRITISTKEKGNYSIQLHNAFGHLLLDESATGRRQKTIEIDLESFASGVYVITLIDGENLTRRKFIKQ